MSDRNAALDALQGWLILAPFVFLCVSAPWGPLLDAPDVLSIGVAIAALGAIPPLVLAALRIFRGSDGSALTFPFPLGFPLLLAVLALGAQRVDAGTDSFSAWRSIIGLAAAIGYFVAGATLGLSGCRVLQRGLPVATLLLMGSLAATQTWQGSMGNTGDLSEAALPGAVLGAGAFLTATGLLAFAGFSALLIYALYVGIVPVYAGVGALVLGFVFALLGSVVGKSGGENGRQAAAKRARLLLVALLLSVVSLAVKDQVASLFGAQPEETARMESPVADAATTTGGFEFRKLTWASIPTLLEEQGEDGAGPGQFQAAYPPYRSVEEIELSSFERREPTPIEVEHAHNDVLTALVEHGWWGGGAFVLFLLLMIWRGLIAIGGEQPIRRDFGIVSIVMIGVALVNSPLLYGVASPIAAFTAFGIVSSSGLVAADERRKTDLLPPLLAIIALLLLAPKALTYYDYGRALAEIPSAARVVDGRERLDSTKLKLILDRALEARPDAPEALEKYAQSVLADPSSPLEEQRAAHAALVAVRPHSIAGLIGSGVVESRAGTFDRAAKFFDAAFALDSGNPLILRNRVRLAFDRRDLSAFTAALSDLEERSGVDAKLLDQYLREALLTARLELAQPVCDQIHVAEGRPKIDTTSQDDLYKAADLADKRDRTDLARAFRAAFHTSLALEHLEAGLAGQARISARQVFQNARNSGADTGPARLRLAAANAAAGDIEKAREVLREGPIRLADRRALPSAFTKALEEAGLLASSSQIAPR